MRVSSIQYLVCLLSLSVACGLPLNTALASFKTFDVPGSNQTYATSINKKGEIAGYYGGGAHDALHGFVRKKNGAIITFDAPDADTTTYQYGTVVQSINSNGSVTGWFYSNSGQFEGFTRTSAGKFKTFQLSGNSTYVYAINDTDTVAGNYTSETGEVGFLRTKSGRTTTFQVEQDQQYVSTLVTALNSEGDVTGFEGGDGAGYIRTTDGNITTFYISDDETRSMSISNTQFIAGWSFSFDGDQVYSGFVRDSGGGITSFSAKDAGSGMDHGTLPQSVNDSGVAVGYYIDDHGTGDASTYHGFERTTSGSITEFDASGAGSGYYQGTWPIAINDKGVITGYYIDSNGNQHGFVGKP